MWIQLVFEEITVQYWKKENISKKNWDEEQEAL